VNTNNTWTWNGTDWTQQNPAHQPPDRYGAAAAYDPAIGRVMVFGGGAGGGYINDTWSWTGTDWKQLNPSGSPSAREGARMAFMKGSGRVVLFGGEDANGPLGDTWSFVRGLSM